MERTDSQQPSVSYFFLTASSLFTHCLLAPRDQEGEQLISLFCCYTIQKARKRSGRFSSSCKQQLFFFGPRFPSRWEVNPRKRGLVSSQKHEEEKRKNLTSPGRAGHVVEGQWAWTPCDFSLLLLPLRFLQVLPRPPSAAAGTHVKMYNFSTFICVRTDTNIS